MQLPRHCTTIIVGYRCIFLCISIIWIIVLGYKKVAFVLMVQIYLLKNCIVFAVQ